MLYFHSWNSVKTLIWFLIALYVLCWPTLITPANLNFINIEAFSCHTLPSKSLFAKHLNCHMTGTSIFTVLCIFRNPNAHDGMAISEHLKSKYMKPYWRIRRRVRKHRKKKQQSRGEMLTYISVVWRGFDPHVNRCISWIVELRCDILSLSTLRPWVRPVLKLATLSKLFCPLLSRLAQLQRKTLYKGC